MRRSSGPTAPPTAGGPSAGPSTAAPGRQRRPLRWRQGGLRPRRLRPVVGRPRCGYAGTELTYIPFGRDAPQLRLLRQRRRAGHTLTSAQLTSLFSTGPQTIGGVEIMPCGIQTGSGTFAVLEHGARHHHRPGEHRDGHVQRGRHRRAAAGERRRRPEGQGRRPAGQAGHHRLLGRQLHRPVERRRRQPAARPPATVIVDLGAIDALGKPYTGTAPSHRPVGDLLRQHDLRP